MIKRSTLLIAIVITALTFTVIYQWLMLRDIDERQLMAYDAIFQTAGRASSIIVSGELSKKDLQELTPAMVLLALATIGTKDRDDLYHSLSHESINGFCDFIKNSEKTFPDHSESPLDAEVFPKLRPALQTMRNSVEKEFKSREINRNCSW